MTVVKTITVSNGLVQSGASGTVDTADITASAVTYAKVQNTAAGSVLLGRGAGLAGAVQEITLGTGLSMSGTVLSATGGGTGTVTSFSAGNLSPLFTTSVATATTTPALTFAAVSQAANLHYASPDGAAGVPAFRALVTADLAAGMVTYAKIQNVTAGKLLGSVSASAAAPGEVTVGSGLSLTAGTLSATGGGGTVTSVGLALSGTFPFAVSGSPVTTSGTITLTTVNSSTPNVFYCTQPSGTGPWLARVIVPADLPVFAAAGGTHAAGAVPDPGATAHSNFPYLLGDNASWRKPLTLLAVNTVATSESTSSTALVDLTTLDSVSFTLDETRNVLCAYVANTYNTSASNSYHRDVFNFDGSDDTGSQTDTVAVAGFANNDVMLYQKSLAAGAHTVKVRHASPFAGTGTWRARTLAVFLAP